MLQHGEQANADNVVFFQPLLNILSFQKHTATTFVKLWHNVWWGSQNQVLPMFRRHYWGKLFPIYLHRFESYCLVSNSISSNYEAERKKYEFKLAFQGNVKYILLWVLWLVVSTWSQINCQKYTESYRHIWDEFRHDSTNTCLKGILL